MFNKSKINSSNLLVDEKQTDQNKDSSQSLTLKQQAGDAANRWLEKNRSLVLRQTPVWAQSLAGLLIGLGTIAVAGGILFRLDEVITVKVNKSIGGTVEKLQREGSSPTFSSKTEMYYKGQPLLRFDTRQAASEKEFLTNQIMFETKKLDAQFATLRSQQITLLGRKALEATS